ncbi:hypothetical protein CASFOL_004606 [Castilleja foliolosa]|uniref:Uncharacterized protein n=1 Tax=Castilleja foliolosa TaxID=1961234 RepID=A0ABD3EF08_9LAMI
MANRWVTIDSHRFYVHTLGSEGSRWRNGGGAIGSHRFYVHWLGSEKNRWRIGARAIDSHGFDVGFWALKRFDGGSKKPFLGSEKRFLGSEKRYLGSQKPFLGYMKRFLAQSLMLSMANFDENHPDVLKIDNNYYNPADTIWTVRMERVLLEFMINQNESIRRGAKKAPVAINLPFLKSALETSLGISPSIPEIHSRFYDMKERYTDWKAVLSRDGVFVDTERGLICIDTTVCKGFTAYEYGDDAFRRYYLYDLPPLWGMLEAVFA